MNVGLLEAGSPPNGLSDRFGTYGDMFRRLFGPAFKLRVYDVKKSLPTTADVEDAYLITGSSSGVYDKESWISELETFVRETIGKKPMLGICFGHQLMAQALGGEVVKVPKGWGLGLHHYDIKAKAAWMDTGGGFALPASHQDQVVTLPPNARVLAGSEFTPYAMIEYPGLRAMSMQPHPEFEPDFAKALIDRRRGSQVDHAVADVALSSLKEPNDRRRVDVWMRRFFNTA